MYRLQNYLNLDQQIVRDWFKRPRQGKQMFCLLPKIRNTQVLYASPGKEQTYFACSQGQEKHIFRCYPRYGTHMFRLLPPARNTQFCMLPPAKNTQVLFATQNWKKLFCLLPQGKNTHVLHVLFVIQSGKNQFCLLPTAARKTNVLFTIQGKKHTCSVCHRTHKICLLPPTRNTHVLFALSGKEQTCPA